MKKGKRKMFYEIGQKAEFSKTISESDVYIFAGLSGDFNPVHVNEIKAGESFAKKRIAHGILVSGLISSVIGMKMPGEGTIYLEQDSKFVKPVYIGDTVTACVSISEILNKEKNILKLDTIVTNQNNEIVIEGYAVVKAPRKEK